MSTFRARRPSPTRLWDDAERWAVLTYQRLCDWVLSDKGFPSKGGHVGLQQGAF